MMPSVLWMLVWLVDNSASLPMVTETHTHTHTPLHMHMYTRREHHLILASHWEVTMVAPPSCNTPPLNWLHAMYIVFGEPIASYITMILCYSYVKRACGSHC